MRAIIALEAMQIKKNADHFEGLFDDDSDQPIRVLSCKEAQALEASMPKVSLWEALWIQLSAGLVVIALSAIWWDCEGVMICAIGGVLSAWLPSALFVWRVTAIQKSRCGANVSLIKFYIWEAVKIICVIALLFCVMLWVRPLVWQSLLAGFVVTVKMHAVACCWLSWGKIKQVKS